jgi:hypothetical protein
MGKKNLIYKEVGQDGRFGSVHHFDSVNEKSQITQEILYSEERKRGRALGIPKEVAEQQKIMDKPMQ